MSINERPCMGFAFRSSASHRSRKKCLILRKNTKNRQFGQNLKLFEATTVFQRFDELFSQDSQKLAHFAKRHDNSSIWQKLDTVRRNHRVLAFWRTFHLKEAKSASFRKETRKLVDFAKTCKFSKKPPCLGVLTNFSGKSCKKFSFHEKTRKTIDLAKTCNILKKPPCFGVFTNFSAKSCKKGLISQKTRENRRFSQTSNLLEETTVFGRFDELFSQKSQKVPHFAEKRKKSPIWAKLGTFSEKPPCFCVFNELFTKKRQKVPHFVKKPEKSSISRKLASFGRNHRVWAFWRTFQAKVIKSASFREKTRKIID